MQGSPTIEKTGKEMDLEDPALIEISSIGPLVLMSYGKRLTSLTIVFIVEEIIVKEIVSGALVSGNIPEFTSVSVEVMSLLVESVLYKNFVSVPLLYLL